MKVLLQYGAEVNTIATIEEVCQSFVFWVLCSLCLSVFPQGDKLTPLDYCGDAPEIAELLRANNALTSAELLADMVQEAGTTEQAATEQPEKDRGEVEAVKPADLVLPVRPSSPSKQSLQRVVFESEEVPGMGESEGRESPTAPRRPSAKSLDLENVRKI